MLANEPISPVHFFTPTRRRLCTILINSTLLVQLAGAAIDMATYNFGEMRERFPDEE